MIWFVDLFIWIGLFILVVFEIVFGIDNFVFIVILVNKLLLVLCDCVWMIGLGLVLLMCMVLLVVMLWLIGLIKLLFMLGLVDLLG